ncbi:MAG: UbiA family prenyltransferase [Candidatus Micrarchaeota archaeon]|nr:UbiA family prenyltransferase [Candidatus Micrarchaeota archaeon]
MKAISAYLRLFRIEHALLLAVAVLLGELLSGALPALPLLLCSLAVPVFIEMGSFALNDCFDVKTDKANKRGDRPIASGEIKPSHALIAAASCYIIGIAAALPLPPAALCITIIFAFLSIAYNFKLKELLLVGNMYIAASMAIPFLFGNLVVAPALYPQIWAIALVAFVAGLGREIIKSAEDMEGDVLHRNARTLPVVIGKKNSLLFAALLYAALVPLSLSPFALGLRTNILSLGLIIITALSFAAMAYVAARATEKDSATLISLRKSSLLALGVGLLGYAASLL